MYRTFFACALALACSATAQAGQIYKWVDAQGNVHFAAQPPEGQSADPVNPRINQPKAPPPAAVPAKSSTERQQQADARVREEVIREHAERQRYCENISYNLAQLKNNPRLRTEVDGELRRLSEDERQSRIGELQAAIAKDCQ